LFSNDRGVKLVKTLKAEEIAEVQSIAVYLEAMQVGDESAAIDFVAYRKHVRLPRQT
jgi:hypothetical protein